MLCISNVLYIYILLHMLRYIYDTFSFYLRVRVLVSYYVLVYSFVISIQFYVIQYAQAIAAGSPGVECVLSVIGAGLVASDVL